MVTDKGYKYVIVYLSFKEEWCKLSKSDFSSDIYSNNFRLSLIEKTGEKVTLKYAYLK